MLPAHHPELKYKRVRGCSLGALLERECLEAKLGVKAARADTAAFLTGVSPVSARGVGLEYVDFRDLEEGDDARFIDWRLSARSLDASGSYRLVVKVFRAERRVRAVLVADLSTSMLFGRKARTLAYSASVISAAAYELEDDLALVLGAGGRVLAYPWARPDRVPHLVSKAACGRRAKGALSLPELARAASRLAGPYILLTDYANKLEELNAAIAALKGRGLGLVLVYEPAELKPPTSCLATLKDPETGAGVGGRLEDLYSAVQSHVRDVRALLEWRRVPYVEAAWPWVRERRAALANLYLRVRRRLPATAP
jgi:uncharacterized protein (DUF58 family)